jgi:hypothetical protein
MPEQPQGDWITHLVDSIERYVTLARERTTRPLILLARALVFGLMTAILAMTAAVLAAIMVVRIIENYLPGGVWKSHFITGALFTGAGLFLMSKRNQKAAS